jgi:outer membrane protein OmpA-like peptidoglycan-associated protein
VPFALGSKALERDAQHDAARAPAGPDLSGSAPQRLLALQRSSGNRAVGRLLQRACPPAPTGIGRTPSAELCATESPDRVTGSIRLLNCRDSTELVDGQEASLASLITRARSATSLVLHGYASPDGPGGDYNANLACKRAAALAGILRGAGVTTPITLVSHGATTAWGSTEDNRSVVAAEQAPAPVPPPPTPDPPSPPPAPPLPGVATEDCTPAHETEIRSALAESQPAVSRTVSQIMTTPLSPAARAALELYMGATGPSHVSAISLRLLKIRHGLQDITVECEYAGGLEYWALDCAGASLAGTRQIPFIDFGYGDLHVCEPNFSGLTRAQRVTTLVHEGAHRFIDADDEAYYTLTCAQTPETAALSDDDRRDNADSYGCLVEALGR